MLQDPLNVTKGFLSEGDKIIVILTGSNRSAVDHREIDISNAQLIQGGREASQLYKLVVGG